MINYKYHCQVENPDNKIVQLCIFSLKAAKSELTLTRMHSLEDVKENGQHSL